MPKANIIPGKAYPIPAVVAKKTNLLFPLNFTVIDKIKEIRITKALAIIANKIVLYDILII